MDSMARKVAIVTGGGSGIGRATALALAGAGYWPVVVARTQAALEETVRRAGAGEAFAADVCDPAVHERLVADVMARHGRIDVAIHCAGGGPTLPVEETTPDIWRQTIDTNLSGAFYLSRAVWPTFRRQGGGVIVLISSLAGRDPFPGFAAYGAAKAGVNLLGLALAREGEAHGIRVHTIAPGAVETGAFRSLTLPFIADWPTEKTLTPDDVARVIVDCVQGSLRYTSGEVITIHKTM